MAVRDLRAAKRYANALFNAALKMGILDQIEKDMDSIFNQMQNSEPLHDMWESPMIPGAKKNLLLSEIFADSAHTLTLSFLQLLADKRRENILSEVRHELHLLGDASRKLVRAEATFAVAPTADEQQRLAQSLAARTGDRVELTCHIDPSILGGVVVRLRDTIIDGSLRGRLRRLEEQLLGATYTERG